MRDERSPCGGHFDAGDDELGPCSGFEVDGDGERAAMAEMAEMAEMSEFVYKWARRWRSLFRTILAALDKTQTMGRKRTITLVNGGMHSLHCRIASK